MTKETPALIRFLRWGLLFVLLYCLGRYLGGPSYRVIVRSSAFVLSCIGVTAFASELACRRWHLPAVGGVLYTIISVTGFVWAAQHYYAGGKNSDYVVYILFWGALMGLNLALYLNSLFVSLDPPRQLVDPPHQPAGEELVEQDNGPVRYFDVRLFCVDDSGERGGLYYQLRGGPPLPEGFVLDGYSSDHFVSLEEHWQTIVNRKIAHFKTSLTLYETIIKFGDTMQLVNDYELEIDTHFRP